MATSIKQKIWDKLDKDGYITDGDLFNIYRKEPNFYSAEMIKCDYFRLKNCLQVHNFHNDYTTETTKGHRCYLVRNAEMKKLDSNRWLKIPKVYYEYLNKLNP